MTLADYEQQRRDLLRKHGIDLEDGNGGTIKTKRMDRKEADRIMGEGPGGVFTWREKNRKKVCVETFSGVICSRYVSLSSPILCKCGACKSRLNADISQRCGTNSYSECIVYHLVIFGR